MLIVTIVASTILIGISALLAVRGTAGGYRWAAAELFLAALLATCISYPVLPDVLLVFCGIAVLFALRPMPVKTYVLVASLGSVLLYVAGVVMEVPYVREARQLRAEYPLASLADRLAYENHVHRSTKQSTSSGAIGAAPSEPAGNVGAELRHLEDDVRIYNGRGTTLEEVHASYVKQFIDLPGLGAGRRLRTTRERIRLKRTWPIPLPRRSYEDSISTAMPTQDVKQAPDDSLAYLVRDSHRQAYFDFVNADGFGYVLDRYHVAGFEAHRFSEMPTFTIEDPKERWEIAALDLVSLLKHPEPVAYVSENLPRMEELRHAPVRPLDVFETKALAALRRGEDIQSYAQPDFIRMLGSVRAAKQCLACHNVERGELLGAFSYRLRMTKEHRE